MDILEVVALITAFLAGSLISLFSFREGLRLGMNAAKGDAPKSVEGPVKAIRKKKQAKADKFETDKFEEGLKNIASYDGRPQKKDGDER